MSYQLPQLPYEYSALEPYLDAQTMAVHYAKHHQGYLNKLNAAVEKHPHLFEKSILELLTNLESVPEDIRSAVKNNGGGYYHHSLFWEMMTPNSSEKPLGASAQAIEKTFESFPKFKEQFTAAASTQFGSGWTWLVQDSAGNLKIVRTPNQDSPVSDGLTPLLGIDVWEHAYYLKYQNRRPEYIDQWWNVVNWETVENNFKK